MSRCRGAFSLPFPPASRFECSQCGTWLESFSADLCGHQLHEIDPSIPFEPRLGEYSVGYVVPGTVACLMCGLVYPRSYSCCPGVIATALELLEHQPEKSQVAIAFLEAHSATLLNALRGGLGESFQARHRQTLYHVIGELSRRDEFAELKIDWCGQKAAGRT